MHQRTCPYCDALQSPEARFCRSCGKPLPRLSDAPEFVGSTSGVSFSPLSLDVAAYARSFRQPLAETLPVLGALSALVFAGGAIAAATTGASEPLCAAGMVAITFLSVLLYFWLAGMHNRHKGKAFLFAGIGLLFGIIIGIDQAAYLEETVVSTLAGTLAGAIIGGILVLPVYLLNRSATERLRRPTPPACVALGRGELFYERIHMRIDPWYDRVDLYLEHSTPMRLNIVRRRAPTTSRRLSISCHFPSIILIPPRMASAVQEAFPHLAPRRISSIREV